MKLSLIIAALNNSVLKKDSGKFIGRTIIEPTAINIYSKIRVEIYFHETGKNTLIFTYEGVDRIKDKKSKDLPEDFSANLLSALFNNISNHEVIQV